MKKLFENTCTTPWTEYFTTQAKNCTCTTPWTEYFTTQAKNCTEGGKQYADGVNGTSDDDSNVYFERRMESNWLLNNPDSPCKGDY